MNESIYGAWKDALPQVLHSLVSQIEDFSEKRKEETGEAAYEHLIYRIKSEESMRDKCRRKNLPETPSSALYDIHDAIGIRIVCCFLNDIYENIDFIRSLPGCTIVKGKDYIKNAKPNGYRSYHMILKMPVRFLGNTSETAALPCLEVQIRTIAMDCWASIEHELKYKHDIANPELMQQELKHCSDQIASTDLSLSTLKELILTPNADPDANSNTSAGAEKPVASDCRGIPLG